MDGPECAGNIKIIELNTGVSITSDAFQSIPFGGGPNVRFKCVKGEGAILNVQSGKATYTYCDKTSKMLLGEHMLKNYKQWLSDLRDAWFLQPEELFLVTGTYTTHNWEAATFHKDGNTSVGIDVTVDAVFFEGKMSIDWKTWRNGECGFRHGHIHTGQIYPRHNTVPSFGASCSTCRDPPENQCIFLRGWRVKEFRLVASRLVYPTSVESTEKEELRMKRPLTLFGRSTSADNARTEGTNEESAGSPSPDSGAIPSQPPSNHPTGGAPLPSSARTNKESAKSPSSGSSAIPTQSPSNHHTGETPFPQSARTNEKSAGSPSSGSSAIPSQPPSNQPTGVASLPPSARRAPNAANSPTSGRLKFLSRIFNRRRTPSASFKQGPGSPFGSASVSTTETASAPQPTQPRYNANADTPSTPVQASKPLARHNSQSRRSSSTPSVSTQSSSPSDVGPSLSQIPADLQRNPNHRPHPSVAIPPVLPPFAETLATPSEIAESDYRNHPQLQRLLHLSPPHFISESSAGARQVEEPEAKKAAQVSASRSTRTDSILNLSVEQTISSTIQDQTGGGGDGDRMMVTLREPGKSPVRYRLRNCIGRGQFGTVYLALNLNTGQTATVKRISLVNVPDVKIKGLLDELKLLMRFSHPSIVKYEGMSRDSDALSIVAEYVENGSLLHTLKDRSNELLVADYVAKVLEGLHYLHQKGVVHCDLKSTNILTTKKGDVKLSDSGLSPIIYLRTLTNLNVAWVSNWTAPEIIELQEYTPASDIWSLGCTMIELITGKPPYSEIANDMRVMFRILDDERPSLPEDCSGLLRDFLLQCFQKDPSQRPSAETLLKHPWLKISGEPHKDDTSLGLDEHPIASLEEAEGTPISTGCTNIYDFVANFKFQQRPQEAILLHDDEVIELFSHPDMSWYLDSEESPLNFNPLALQTDILRPNRVSEQELRRETDQDRQLIIAEGEKQRIPRATPDHRNFSSQSISPEGLIDMGPREKPVLSTYLTPHYDSSAGISVPERYKASGSGGNFAGLSQHSPQSAFERKAQSYLFQTQSLDRNFGQRTYEYREPEKQRTGNRQLLLA